MAEAYVIEALRTAGGRRNGALRDWHPVDMGAAVIDALIPKTGIDPAAVEDVIVGCVSQVGEQSFHIGRSMVLASVLPQSVPAVTIDRQCGSSQQALHFAAQAVMSGTQDVVLAAGVEHMTRVPMGSPTMLAIQAGVGKGPWSAALLEKFGVTLAEFQPNKLTQIIHLLRFLFAQPHTVSLLQNQFINFHSVMTNLQWHYRRYLVLSQWEMN